MTDADDSAWEAVFAENQLLWGLEPAASAVLAAEHFARAAVQDVLIPGVGYGRNATPFLERGMSVTGIEISETAIALARSRLGLDIVIHQGSVERMPYDERLYQGIFCYGLLYLLDAPAREKLLRDCHAQLAPGGQMIFTVLSKTSPTYGRGLRLGDDRYEIAPGVSLYFYDAASVERELGPYGLVEQFEISERAAGSTRLPFIHATCTKR